MHSLIEHFDGDEKVKEVLGHISDETIDKVFAGKVGLSRSCCIEQAL